MLYCYGPHVPHLGPEVYVAPNATVIGRVRLGAQASVWHGSVLRGDIGPIEVGERSNIQDNCVVHVTEGRPGVWIGADVVIGHRVVVHECRIEDLCLIGMGSVILDGAVIGRGAIVAAGAVVREGQQVPPLALVAGVPAVVRTMLPESSLAARARHAAGYVALALRYLRGEAVAIPSS
jgi:carbonic anhydrase/acetyltransferase-like protein (isoleucine patch superfamily)